MERIKHFDQWESEKDPYKRTYWSLYIERYKIELAVYATIFISILNFVVGRTMNSRIAFAWLANVQQNMMESFAMVPPECKSDDDSKIVTF